MAIPDHVVQEPFELALGGRNLEKFGEMGLKKP
jgi:hypothetical protein